MKVVPDDIGDGNKVRSCRSKVGFLDFIPSAIETPLEEASDTTWIMFNRSFLLLCAAYIIGNQKLQTVYQVPTT